MNELHMAIAGIPVAICSSSTALLDDLRRRFDGFLTNHALPAYQVRIELLDESQEQTYISPPFRFEEQRVVFDLTGYTGRIDPANGADLRIASPHPGDGAEYFLRVVYALLCYQAGGLMIHAAGVVRDARAFVFFGHSGAGKTTAARNALDGVVLNDDLIVLMPTHDHWLAHGTPFTNPSQAPPSSSSAPVAALLRIVQSPRVALKPIQGAQALAELMTSVPVLNGSPTPPLERCLTLLDSVPAYRLFLLPDPSFWPLIENL